VKKTNFVLSNSQGITQMITRIRPAYLAALTVALGLFLASHAFATVQPNTPTPVATANADASAGAVATSNSGSFSTASTGPSNANANNAISFEDRLQAPALLAAAVYPSGLCASGGSLGISVPGGAISGGRTKNENESCAARVVSSTVCRPPGIGSSDCVLRSDCEGCGW
jgi:hypothetical protein